MIWGGFKMNWQDKKEVKKGNIGEDIISDFLEGHNFILYKPITDGAHKIDYFAHSGRDKKVICCEVKTKRRMAKMAFTGFNVSCYKHYMEIYEKHNIETFVFFVDDFEACVYGQWLNKLADGKVIEGRNSVIVWPLSSMKKIRDIDDETLTELRQYTTENYNYSNVKKYFT
jgi:hypothetical protein